jgi:hypothetical protein
MTDNVPSNSIHAIDCCLDDTGIEVMVTTTRRACADALADKTVLNNRAAHDAHRPGFLQDPVEQLAYSP